MSAILMSIQPKWCALIASGKKTIEVRKTAPKETPFKVYIYATKPKARTHPARIYNSYIMPESGKCGSGKVIGEFICDRIEQYEANERGWYIYPQDEVYMWTDEIAGYGKGKPLYGLHISELKIYDEPRELSDFKRKGFLTEIDWLWFLYPNTHCHYEAWAKKFEITRPPQSWCYVEDRYE